MDKTTFSNEEVVQALNHSYYAVKVDFDSQKLMNYQGKRYKGKALAKKFGVEGLPIMVYVSADFSDSKKIVGYKTSKQLIKTLDRLIRTKQ